jgi:hypothetical protein
MSWTQVNEEEVKIEPTAVGVTVSNVDIAEMVHDITTAKAKKPKAMKPKVSVLEEAQNIIYGDREKTYGHPAKNLKTIATMWSAYMNNMDDGNFTLTAKDVAAMMMLVKVARFANDPSHRDNLVDVCGYAALIERCDEVK